jgi:hypothetical protein
MMFSRFKDILKNVGETIGQAAPGLSNAIPEITAEVKRLGIQGSAEIASLLYQGHGYVPYGAGQATDIQNSVDSPQQPAMESPQHMHDGREQ